MRRVLEGFTPPVGVVWVAARIEEAATADDAAAVAIDTIPLSPPVADVNDPPTYTFTTTAATLAGGWYRVVWLDATGVEDFTAWMEFRALSPYAPTVGDVASILRLRAIEPGGHPVTNFTDQTNPTAYEVQNLIAMFTPLVFARLGRMDDLGCTNAQDLIAASRTVAAQRVALEVEASYWAEEIGEQASVDARRQLLEADVGSLVTGLEACRASSDGGGDGGESDSRSDPAWRFPYHRPLRF